MAIRIIVSIDALPGKGSDLARARAPRMAEVRLEPGCEQFDLYQNIEDPDKLVLVERWTDEASLAVHAELTRQRPPVGAEFRAGPGRAERFTVD